MTILEVFLQFGTVFVGAFLAFVLENLRERQQLRRWANEYLRRVRIDLQQSKGEEALAELNRVITAYTSFIAKGENHVASEAAWNALMWFRLEQYPTVRQLVFCPQNWFRHSTPSMMLDGQSRSRSITVTVRGNITRFRSFSG